MLSNARAQGLRFDLANIRPLEPVANAIGHDEAIALPWNVLPRNPRQFPVDLFEGARAFKADAFIAERWGKAVTLLPGQRAGPYRSTGVFSGGGALYP